jgi:4-amino-4-deoxy-L-arabinose transferase-like glycosyltransferase
MSLLRSLIRPDQAEPGQGPSFGPSKAGRWATVGAKGLRLVSLSLPPLILLLAFAVRAWGARFGLPDYFYHPDEHAIVDRATAILQTGDYNPHWFNYPSAYIYLQALSYIPYFLLSAARGFGDRIPGTTPYGFYFAGRLMTALVGTLTVGLVYTLGRRIFDRKTGLLASVLLAFSLLHTVHSHYVTADVPVAFLITLSLEKRSGRHYVLAGVFGGLAMSTKYPALITLVPLLLLPFLTTRRGDWSTLGQRVGLALGAFVAGFLLGTPYAFLDLNSFLNSLGSVLNHYGASQPGFEGSDSALWYLRQILGSADVAPGLLALAGIGWAAFRRSRKDALLLAFVIPYYLLLSLWRVRFERHLVALLPLLVILAARFVVEGVSALARRWPAARRAETPALAAVAVLVILMPVRAIIDFDRALSRKDQRTIAAEWVNANVPPGSKVVTEALSIPLDEERFEIIQLVRIDSEELDWYREEGIHYIVVSDGHWRVLFQESDRYAREIETYNDILDHSTLLGEFSAGVPSSLNRTYPNILIYHFPQVLVLNLV